MVNGISEKGLSMNHKVKFMIFLGGTSEKILDKLDDITKEKSGILKIHVGTNDVTNIANLLANVKKILNEVSKESPYTSIACSSNINCKDRRKCRKT